jgi:fatty acid-binding protein DegV
METRLKDLRAQGKMTIAIAHTENDEEAEKFKDELIKEFPDIEFTYVNPLSLSVSCHIGPGALAVGTAIKY